MKLGFKITLIPNLLYHHKNYNIENEDLFNLIDTEEKIIGLGFLSSNFFNQEFND